jgi:hypothetical protein
VRRKEDEKTLRESRSENCSFFLFIFHLIVGRKYSLLIIII